MIYYNIYFKIYFTINTKEFAQIYQNTIFLSNNIHKFTINL